MTDFILLGLAGLLIGSLGTLIGAGGGFLLVPLLLLAFPGLSPEIVTALSMATVAANALSGTVAYARSGRIDYKAGILFSISSIPGSVLGVFAVQYLPQALFHMLFGALLLGLAIYLLRPKRAGQQSITPTPKTGPGWVPRRLRDMHGTLFTYSYHRLNGILISVLVGFISPLLGIGGGIIHVPAMVQWLGFPVYIATATSHFILAVMALVSTVVHAFKGHYNDPVILNMLGALLLGVIPGAQLGAWLSHKIPTTVIIRALGICLALVAVRILLSGTGV